MKQQPDHLFREKLESYGKEVPPMAWDRIESGLQNRKLGVVWMSIAASVTAVLVSAAFFYFYRDNADPIALKAPGTELKENNGVVVPGPAKRNTPDTTQVNLKEIGPVESSPTPKGEVTGNLALRATQAGIENQAPPEKEIPLSPEEALQEQRSTARPSEDATELVASPYTEPTQLAFRAPAEQQSVTIVLTADQTSEYLKTKNVTAKATPEEKKSSTLKKLLKKAADLKVNQDPFGELRQRKNEILALNFRSEKQRGQKK